MTIRYALYVTEPALEVATALEADDRVAQVRYPYLASHPQHELAVRQQSLFHGVLPIGQRLQYLFRRIEQIFDIYLVSGFIR